MSEVKPKIGEGGSVVIPARYRKSLGLKSGDDVILVLEEGEVRVMTPQQAVRRAQALVRRYVPKGRRLVDELLRERREETARG